MRRIYHQSVHASGYELLRPLVEITRSPHSRSYPQPTLTVFGGIGVLDLLLYIFNSYQTFQMKLLVDH